MSIVIPFSLLMRLKSSMISAPLLLSRFTVGSSARSISAYYFGRLYDKPYIGDATRHIETEDIRRANNVVLLGSVLALAVFAVVRIIVSINVRGILWF